jgi:hypothetical protein
LWEQFLKLRGTPFLNRVRLKRLGVGLRWFGRASAVVLSAIFSCEARNMKSGLG